MTTAVAILRKSEPARASLDSPHVARVEVIQDMGAAETVWRSVENDAFIYSPFQRFDFLNAWFEKVGSLSQSTPLVVVARNALNQPLLLMPLEMTGSHGRGIARFLGGKHATFGMGICRRDFAVAATKKDVDAILSGIRRNADGVAALALTQQPRSWQFLPNPLRHLGGQASHNTCPMMVMRPGAKPETRISNSIRRRLNNKERKLRLLPDYQHLVARSDTDIKRLLDAFFVIKPLRLAEQGLPNVFADPGVKDFIYQVCLAKRQNGRRLVELHGLEYRDEILAVFGGCADDERFSMTFNTYAISEHARHSPGLVLLRHIIDHYAALNYTSIDLGTGSDHYKRLFCKQTEDIFDSFVPLTLRGRFIAAGMSANGHAKRLVKKSARLQRIAEAIRALFLN
jgi:CelD/BcsL family acetyltransferase involved in cellulose biosynthesis